MVLCTSVCLASILLGPALVSATPLLSTPDFDARSLPGSSLISRSTNTSNGTSPILNFTVASGGYDNYFYRDNLTAAQVLLTSSNSTSPLRRLVVALPAGNSGALTYFLPYNNTNGTSTNGASTTPVGVSLLPSSLCSTQSPYNQTGIKGTLSFTTSTTLGVTVVGAVRAMRDYVEGQGTMHAIFNYTLGTYNESHVVLHRKWINGTKTLDLEFSARQGISGGVRFNVTPSKNVTYGAPKIDFVMNGTQGLVDWRVVTNETSLVGLGTSQLFLNQTAASKYNASWALVGAAKGLSDGSDLTAQKVSFLTYSSAFTAGGWRFLTYFGRDSLITLRLLMPLLTSEAIESALGAVIERTNSTGALCHEETVGDYASFVNMGNNRSDLGNQPYYDYKMIDTDLFLLPAMAHYFLDLPQGKGRAAQFLARNASLQNGTSYRELVQRNVDYNLNRAQAFADNPVYSNLLGLREGVPVGNWRDSNEGLGYGNYPFDVNTALVPSALRAVASLSSASILPSPNGTKASQYASVWETKSYPFFEVQIDNSTAQARLTNFVSAANLSQSLIGGSAGTNGSAGGVVARDMIEGDSGIWERANDASNWTGSSANTSFYALSLDKNGSKVEVMNSDLGFNLLYANNVTESALTNAVTLLQPYPKGLLTNIGMVVANPAYDSNTTNIQVLNRAAYHGTVTWSFQQALMAAGLARQLSFCDNSTVQIDYNPPSNSTPSWCTNSGLVAELKAAQIRLWNSINGAKAEIFSEVWSYNFSNATNSFSVTDLGSLSPSGTESDAIQLWSFTFLALADPTATNATLMGRI